VLEGLLAADLTFPDPNEDHISKLGHIDAVSVVELIQNSVTEYDCTTSVPRQLHWMYDGIESPEVTQLQFRIVS
jgi:hypothetical protein